MDVIKLNLTHLTKMKLGKAEQFYIEDSEYFVHRRKTVTIFFEGKPAEDQL